MEFFGATWTKKINETVYKFEFFDKINFAKIDWMNFRFARYKAFLEESGKVLPLSEHSKRPTIGDWDV